MNPTVVEYFTVVPPTWGLGRVRGGEWDRTENCRRVDDIAIYNGLVQRFEDGNAWEDTIYYEWATERLDEHGRFRGSAR